MLKKFFTTIVAVVITVTMYSQETGINWKTMQEALNMNKSDGKIIFVNIYTSWCGWCRKMDQTTYRDKNIITMLNENFISVNFNAEGIDSIKYNNKLYVNKSPGRVRSTHEFTYIMLGQNIGYPSYAFLDSNNNIIGILMGYQDASRLLKVLRYFQTKAYQIQTYDDWSKTQTE